jgi:O-Antigen ligase
MQQTELAPTIVQGELPRPGSRGATASRLQQYGPYAITLYLLATARWGSGLSLVGGPPYLSDLVLMLLVIDRAAAAAAHRSVSTGVESLVAIFASSLLVLSLIMLVFGSISQNALRDAAPYLYVITVFLVRPPTESSERATSRALMAVLIFHASWVTLAQLDPSLPSGAPVVSTGVHMLSLRPDIDSLVCGLLAALGLHRALAGRRPAYNLALAAWGTVLVFTLYDRAGLLAFIVEVVIVMLLAPARRRLLGRYDRRVVVAILVMCLPIISVAVSQSRPVKRLLLTIPGTTTTASTEIQGATGTAHARLQSWSALVSYIERDAARNIRGVGFGPDFLHESGADVLLLGTAAAEQEDVRSPHNYLLNTWARLGLIGLILILGILLTGLRLARLVARHASRVRDDDVLAMLLVASIPVVAVVGVVLESPFGALPYFWALGHLSARACQTGAVVPFGHCRGSAPRIATYSDQGTRPAQGTATPASTAW